MKYIIYLLLIIPNLIWAETLICDDYADSRSSPHYLKYERDGDEFIWSGNEGVGSYKYNILHEDDKTLQLIASLPPKVISTFMFNKETNRYNATSLWFDGEPAESKGSCKVIK